MSQVRILIHTVWGTYNHQPVLSQNIREKLYPHIIDNATQKAITIIKIGGYLDHVHCLISMKSEQNICKIMQLIKGESSYWLNKEGFMSTKFNWAIDYYAASIGENDLPKVCNYISNQEEHHRKISFQMEYDKFICDF